MVIMNMMICSKLAFFRASRGGIWTILVGKQPPLLLRRLAKSASLGLKVLPLDAPRRAGPETLIGGMIGWIFTEIQTIYDFQGGRVVESKEKEVAVVSVQEGSRITPFYHIRIVL